MTERTPWGGPPPACPRHHSPHRSRLRGVCSAEPTAGAPPGAVHPAGTSLDDFASGAGLLRLAKKSAGDSARSWSWLGGPGTQEGPGRGGGAVPARAKVRGGSALFTSPRNVLCKHFPLSRGQAPRGCRALNPLRAAIASPGRTGGGAPVAEARTAL